MLRCLILALLVPLASHAAEPDPGAEAFKREIDVRLEVPAREQVDSLRSARPRWAVPRIRKD
jgi:hypothetical protein